jgi:hypothetical protein
LLGARRDDAIEPRRVTALQTLVLAVLAGAGAAGCTGGATGPTIVIDGIRAGDLLVCRTRQYVGGEVVTVKALWPDGPPPIARICTYDGIRVDLPPDRRDLGGAWIVVVDLDDGSRHPHVVYGPGACGDCDPPVDYP